VAQNYAVSVSDFVRKFVATALGREKTSTLRTRCFNHEAMLRAPCVTQSQTIKTYEEAPK
jgi:hypothetical protein